MTDMSKFSGKRETPGQKIHRLEWILETVRSNQRKAGWILVNLSNDDPTAAVVILDTMHGGDQQALLQPNGIFTDEQIELLK